MTTPTGNYGSFQGEDALARLNRLTQQVLSGQRTLNSIRASVDRIAGRAPGDYSTVNDAGYQSAEQVKARIRQIFDNRGVALGPEEVPDGDGTQWQGDNPNVPITGPADPNTGLPRPPQPAPAQPTGPSPEERDAAARREAEERAARERAESEERARRDAYARLNAVLNDYGLGSLGAQVQRWLIEGLSEAEITQRMRETNEFKQRFPAIEERKKKGLSPISPGEYVSYERNVRQMMRAAGLPTGFYDGNDDFTRFISNDLSLSELGDRVTLAANAAFNTPPETRAALERWGMRAGDLTAFWLDPDKAQPLLERKYAAAQLAGASSRTNYGTLNEETATGLAQIGVTEQQAQQGFGALVESRELFTSLDRGEDRIGQREQLGAMFEGNANAQRRIEQRRRRRQGAFEGGGGFASTQQGLTGLGAAE
jgi:hypothetical protein